VKVSRFVWNALIYWAVYVHPLLWPAPTLWYAENQPLLQKYRVRSKEWKLFKQRWCSAKPNWQTTAAQLLLSTEGASEQKENIPGLSSNQRDASICIWTIMKFYTALENCCQVMCA